MIAGAVDVQVALEFFVAILAFAALGVVVIGGAGNDLSTRTIRDDETAIGALGIRLRLDDDPACMLPSAGFIPEGIEQTLRRFRFLEPAHGLCHQGFAGLLQLFVGG